MSLGKHKLTKVFASIVNVIPQLNIYSRMMILADVNGYVTQLENKIQDLEKRIITLEHNNQITQQTRSHIQHSSMGITCNSNCK